MASELDIENIAVRLVLEAISVRYGYDFRGYQPESRRCRVLASLARSGERHLEVFCLGGSERLEPSCRGIFGELAVSERIFRRREVS